MDKCNLPRDGMSSILNEFHLHFIWEFIATSRILVSRQTLVASSCDDVESRRLTMRASGRLFVCFGGTE